MRKVLLLGILLGAFVLSGCAELGVLNSPSSQVSLPDYNKPESEYIVPDFNVLASEFADEYNGKYIVIDGIFQQKMDMFLYIPKHGGRAGAISNISVINMMAPSKQKMIGVQWAMQNKEDGRPLLNINNGDKIRVYAYYVPAMQNVALRSGLYLNGIDTPMIWLMRIVPLEKKP